MPFCSTSTAEVPASDERQDRKIAITGTIGIKSTAFCLVMFFIPHARVLQRSDSSVWLRPGQVGRRSWLDWELCRQTPGVYRFRARMVVLALLQKRQLSGAV